MNVAGVIHLGVAVIFATHLNRANLAAENIFATLKQYHSHGHGQGAWNELPEWALT